MSTQSPSILIVEDDETARYLLQALLESQGYRVSAAATGNAGLETALGAHNDIDLVVADIALPDLNGIDFVQELKALRPNIPVLYMSGYVAINRLSEITRDPDARLLQKPVAPRELFAVVDAMLASRRPTQAPAQSSPA